MFFTGAIHLLGVPKTRNIFDRPLLSAQCAKIAPELLSASSADKGDNSELCKDIHNKVNGTITELFALSKGIKFGMKEIDSLLLLYKTVFLPRLIYNCKAWSGFTSKDLRTLKLSQLSYLRGLLEVSKGVPAVALCLELGVLPTSFKIELKQLLHLKRILEREHDEPVLMVYHEMLKYKEEINWTNDGIGLRKKYRKPSWSFRLNTSIIRRLVMFHINIFHTIDYLTSLPPNPAKNWHA